MSRRMEQILELYQEQLEVAGYHADDIANAATVLTNDGTATPTLMELPDYLINFLELVKESGRW